MANRVAWLTKRVKIGGQWFVRKPIIKTSGFVTEKVEHNGQSVHAAGTFVLEWYDNGKRQRKPLTESTLEAQDELRKKTQTLEARANGGRGPRREGQGCSGNRGPRLPRRSETQPSAQDPSGVRALEMLVAANPGCDFVQDLERRNLMVHFIRAIKEAGLGDRTQNNLFGAIVTFLHAQQHPVVTRKDAPDYTETEIETYSADELGQLFGACTAETPKSTKIPWQCTNRAMPPCCCQNTAFVVQNSYEGRLEWIAYLQSAMANKLPPISREISKKLNIARVAHLATLDAERRPHVIPICFAYDGSVFYSAIDRKPKRLAPNRLARLKNIKETPHVALLVDQYDEDWTRLWYVLVRGEAELVSAPAEQKRAIQCLRAKYSQYDDNMLVDDAPVVRVTPARIIAWGKI